MTCFSQAVLAPAVAHVPSRLATCLDATRQGLSLGILNADVAWTLELAGSRAAEHHLFDQARDALTQSLEQHEALEDAGAIVAAERSEAGALGEAQRRVA